ncbi:PdaC/SigV domain-containing protein [Paenibacillus pinistramenti]|uniref:PdaC/SigV domain-containing protein n=1 Tax=Paenibacillus pinistramenti TaxID=1768003 RepID=UPI001396B76A|nr:DUF4163 domain-containing protein [Paenibacillus pinistramenti]
MTSYIKSTRVLLAAALLLGAGTAPAALSSAASASAVSASASASASAKTAAPIRIALNGTTLTQTAIAKNNTVLIPLAVLRDALGLKVSYDAKTKAYEITRGKVTVTLKPTEYGTMQVTVDGSTQFSDYEWVNQQGRSYVSVHLLSDVLGYRTAWNNSAKIINLIPLQLNDLKVTAKVLNESAAATDFRIEYPVISGLSDASVQQKINQIFKEHAEAYLQDAKERSKELGLGPQGTKNEFDSYYSLTYNRNGYISFRLLSYEYTGGAHGMSALEGITIRLSDGSQAGLSELLKANPDYLKIIDAKVAANLEKTPGYFGGFTTAGDNPGFYLKDEGIVVFFQLYEYLPYAAGFPEYAIPFSALLPDGSSPFEQQ